MSHPSLCKKHPANSLVSLEQVPKLPTRPRAYQTGDHTMHVSTQQYTPEEGSVGVNCEID